MGAVPVRALARNTWLPPDVNASEDLTATTHGGPVTHLLAKVCPATDWPATGRLALNDKQKLRATMRAARRAHVEALPQVTRALILMRPPAPVAGMIPEGSIVGLYHANPFEAPAGGYARWFRENGRRIALPWFADRDSPMQFREWHDPFGNDDLGKGPFGPQPGEDSPVLAPDFVFVPLLAFTADGARLGQGGGHYDRWLASNPKAVPIGLAWDIQLRDTLPVEPHDRHLAAVVTPTRFFRSET